MDMGAFGELQVETKFGGNAEKPHCRKWCLVYTAFLHGTYVYSVMNIWILCI